MNKLEKTHLLVSWVTLALAFSIAFGQLDFAALSWLPFTLVAVGTAFLLHELAHIYVAKKYGCFAEYRMWTWGLILALGLAVVTNGGFVFGAPGAVYIGGKSITRKQNAMISLAGPGTNWILAIGFIILAIYMPILGGSFFLLAQINLILGAFNMIPFGPLDGTKIFSWSPMYWTLAMIVIGGTLFALPVIF